MELSATGCLVMANLIFCVDNLSGWVMAVVHFFTSPPMGRHSKSAQLMIFEKAKPGKAT